MIRECVAVIDWLQVMAVAMFAANCFLAGIVGLCVVEMRAARLGKATP